MLRLKYCCGGNNAIMVVPLWPVNRNGVKCYTALYKCDKCGEFTLRGEADDRDVRNQHLDWSTFVEYLNESQAVALIEEHQRRETEKQSLSTITQGG